jgi:hypothetical protein
MPTENGDNKEEWWRTIHWAEYTLDLLKSNLTKIQIKFKIKVIMIKQANKKSRFWYTNFYHYFLLLFAV